MTRREFVILLASTVGASTCADTFAAQPSPIARIAILRVASPPMENGTDTLKDTLKATLHALGWREGDNLQIEDRWGNGDPTSLPRVAAELVALRPDVLVAVGSGEAKALQAATSDIPIVFMMSSDPVGMGIVDSVAHPGRNTTGTSISPQILWGKRLELVVELIGHRPAKIGWLCNPGNLATKINDAALMQSAKQMGIKVERSEVREAGDIDRAFTAMADSEAVLVQFDPLMDTHHLQIAELATRHRLPAIYDNRGYVLDGGLISYGADVRENWRRGASYVDRILRGTRAGDLPVDQASRFDLVINLNAAKALGLTVPATLLARADEVIE
jgi:putative tryptophan/tyrosine transport system substrate-binding protein